MASNASLTGEQFGRFAELVVSNGASALDLSALRFRFEVRASDGETPNTLIVRIFNLADETVNTVVREYDTVTLSAGYVNATKGTIFQGTVKQFFIGHERNVDSFLEIRAADGDKAYTEGVVNQTFPKGTSDSQQLLAVANALSLPIAETADHIVSSGGILPRGKTMFGMGRIYLREIAKNNDCRWSIQSGVLTLVPNTSYLPGQATVLNPANGLIGFPEQTDNGLICRCYLNPSIQIGQAIQLDNNLINQTQFPASNPNHLNLSPYSQYFPATISSGGLYRVLVVEHIGDTRSNDFFSEVTCLSIDQSAAEAGKPSVLPNG